LSKIKKIFIVLFIISLYMGNTYSNIFTELDVFEQQEEVDSDIFSELDIFEKNEENEEVDSESFTELEIFEQQEKIYLTAKDYISKIGLNSDELIHEIYYEASEGEIELKENNNFIYYSTNNWLVKRILPKTNHDIEYIFYNCDTFGEQIEQELLNINLIMANLKIGDIIIFASNSSDKEEFMLYIGNQENLGYDTLYCKNGKVDKLMLRYYLGQEIKNNNDKVREDDKLPLAGVARPLTYGGVSSYFEPEEKFYSEVPLEKYEFKNDSISNEIFTYDKSEVEYKNDEEGIGKYNYRRIRDALLDTDNVVFNALNLVGNIGAIFLLGVSIILGIRYMLCSDQSQKVHLRKICIVLLVSTVLIFFAKRIAVLIVEFLM